jgi:iron complex transport system ATP-binding protein
VVNELSGGERQLAMIARALAQGARLLVLDEPTASLDFGNQIKVLDEIRALAGRGIAVLMSTHHPDQARRVATRVALLKRGRIVGEGAPEAVLSLDRLARLYDVDPARLAAAGASLAGGGAA